jgi:hypothetical protein
MITSDRQLTVTRKKIQSLEESLKKIEEDVFREKF